MVCSSLNVCCNFATNLTMLLNMKKLFQSKFFSNHYMSSIYIYPSIYYYLPHHPPLASLHGAASGCQNPMVCQTLRGRGRAPSPSQKSKTNNLRRLLGSPIDFLNEPYDLAEILHTASYNNPKNYFLLAFCPEKSKSGSKS